MWESGEALTDNWGKWKSGEPNNAPNHENLEEDCAAVGWGGKLVGDINCKSNRPVICVKERKKGNQKEIRVGILRQQL